MVDGSLYEPIPTPRFNICGGVNFSNLFTTCAKLAANLTWKPEKQAASQTNATTNSVGSKLSQLISIQSSPSDIRYCRLTMNLVRHTQKRDALKCIALSIQEYWHGLISCWQINFKIKWHKQERVLCPGYGILSLY